MNQPTEKIMPTWTNDEAAASNYSLSRSVEGKVAGGDFSGLSDGAIDLTEYGLVAIQVGGGTAVDDPYMESGVLYLPTGTDRFTYIYADDLLASGYCLQIRQFMPDVNPNRDSKLHLAIFNSSYGWPNATGWNSLNQVSVWASVHYYTSPAPTHHRILLETISDPQGLFASGTTVIDASGQIAANAAFTQKLIYTPSQIQSYANSVVRTSTSINSVTAGLKVFDRSMIYMDSISGSGTAAGRLTHFAVMKANTVICTGLPDGHYIKINEEDTVESSGTATWSAAGTIFPLETLEVYDEDDTLVATISPSDGIWGGDQFELEYIWASDESTTTETWAADEDAS